MSGAPVVATEQVWSCPICRAPSGEVFHPATSDRWFGVTGSWAFRQCASCTGLWLDPRPTTAALPLIYADYYTHQRVEGSPDRGSAWRRIHAQLPWHLSDQHGELGYLNGFRPGRVLDVGCGDGSRLQALRREGWSAVGIDLDARAVEVARRTPDADVLIGTIHDIEEGESFDAIVMFHVLEHVEDPLGTLHRARQLLRPGGVVSIATPNATSWLHRIYRGDWRGLEPPRHLQIFAEPGLRNILHEAGFDRPTIFTTARNAASLSFASERAYSAGPAGSRLPLALKGEVLQALEWLRLRWSPYCGEELVAIVPRDPSVVAGSGAAEF